MLTYFYWKLKFDPIYLKMASMTWPKLLFLRPKERVKTVFHILSYIPEMTSGIGTDPIRVKIKTEIALTRSAVSILFGLL